VQSKGLGLQLFPIETTSHLNADMSIGRGRGSRGRLVVTVTDGLGRGIRQNNLRKWLLMAAPASASGVFTIALVSDAKIRALNRQFRGIDRVTDVLSFPMEEQETHLKERRAKRYLGDIVIGLGRASRQARRVGHSRIAELKILALHGLLHLLGYDHTSDNGRMARVERECLRRGGVNVGLLARSNSDNFDI